MAIDIRCTPPTEAGMGLYLNPPAAMRGYADAYQETWGLKREDLVMPIPRLVDLLDQAGISKVVMVAPDKETTIGTKFPNDTLAGLVAQAPDRIIGFAGVDPHKGRKAIDELEWALRDLGLKGVTLVAWEHNLYPNDPLYFPLYELCVKYAVPVTLHCSIHFGRSSKLDYSRPIYIDDVAVRFPELKVIALHGGWPWVAELVAVAWRHKNVYIDVSGVRPRYLAKPGTGWDPLIAYGNTLIQDKVLWGTAWPLQPFARSLQELRELPLKPEVIEKWVHGNAARLLGVK